MKENRKYKLKYDQLRANDPARKESELDSQPSAENEFHETPGGTRSICFVWLDGREQFFSYAYLVSGELSITDEVNLITLRFTSDIVTLKGYGLVDLFSQLVRHTPSRIIQIDPRYAVDDKDWNLTEIIVTPVV